MLSSSEIKGLVLSIEEELFKYFKDTDSKYKAKYRSLVFNIKDQKNKVQGFRAPRTAGPDTRACQNQFRAPLILQGCSPLGLSKIRFVCV